MSEQAVDTQDTGSAQEAEPETAESRPSVVDTHEERNGKPAGYDPVDLSDLPPEKQKALDDRINYLYRQVKDSGRTLGEYRTIAAQQAAKIDELMNGMGVVVDHLHNKSTQAAEETTRQEMQAAFERGDTKEYVAKQKELMRIIAESTTQNELRKTKQEIKQQPQPQQRMPSNAAQLANEGMANGEITADDARFIGQWQDERDERGNHVRPWAANQPDDLSQWSPEGKAALAEAAAVLNNPMFRNMTIQQKMDEVDRRMGVKKSNGSQAVMGGTLQTPGKKQTIRLTPNAERIATKMKFAGPGKSDAEHIAAYRKQIEATQSRTQRSR